MPDIAYVNGRFGPLAEAVVGIEDRGFQFGDGVYEVLRTYRGRPFAMDAHLARLERSAQALRLSAGPDRAQWAALIHEGVRLSGFPETKMYLQVTRGQAPRDHLFPADVSPTVVMTFRELRPMDPALQASGVSALTMPDIRWGRCDIKSVNLLANVLARQQAKEAGVFEAILMRDGLVTEGSVSNVMVVCDDVIRTAPEGPRILSGITREVVLASARAASLSVVERAVTREELFAASEVFLTGTTVEVLSVVRLDGQVVGAGVPGPIAQRLAAQWKASVG